MPCGLDPRDPDETKKVIDVVPAGTHTAFAPGGNVHVEEQVDDTGEHSPVYKLLIPTAFVPAAYEVKTMM
ncbi:hypothetical protein GCM10022383_06470 [Microbacterium soli]|uniref:Uncharacterized protein n=1 Tax=Microbacterium soli TaxID=446075 RepID=A0ABP7MUJ6_9MICO